MLAQAHSAPVRAAPSVCSKLSPSTSQRTSEIRYRQTLPRSLPPLPATGEAAASPERPQFIGHASSESSAPAETSEGCVDDAPLGAGHGGGGSSLGQPGTRASAPACGGTSATGGSRSPMTPLRTRAPRE